MHKWNKLYKYPKSFREEIDGARHYALDNEKLPSVTTILDATDSAEKRESLEKWRQRVGENKAQEIVSNSAKRGTAVHKYLEHHVKGGKILDLTDLGTEARHMAETIIAKGFTDLSEIWGSEAVLFYPGLYAGQTDLCGIYQGRESIIDFKQSNKPKREEWIDNYYHQGAAYAMAHNYMHGTSIEQIVILMCTPDNFFQRFILNGSRFREYMWKWLKRVDNYYHSQ